MVVGKFGGDQSETLPVGLFFPKYFLVVVTTLYQSKLLYLLQLC